MATAQEEDEGTLIDDEAIEYEDDPSVDEDEGFEDQSDVSSTQSLQDDVTTYPVEHGRRYHAYHDGKYARPNDEMELERLDLLHTVWELIHNGLHHFAPIDPSSEQRILDIGTGTGIWCEDMGDAYPSATIIGIDLSPVQPTWVPPNVTFQVSDVDEEWSFKEPFDLIHSRGTTGSVRNWPEWLGQIYCNLRPGGWVEIHDFDIDFHSLDGSLKDEHALREWCVYLQEGAETMGCSLQSGKHLETRVRDAGFVKVHSFKKTMPIGGWPRNQHAKRIGFDFQEQLEQGLEGMSLRPFLNDLKWQRAALEVLLWRVRNDLKNPHIHAVVDIYSVWAQKPSPDCTHCHCMLCRSKDRFDSKEDGLQETEKSDK